MPVKRKASTTNKRGSGVRQSGNGLKPKAQKRAQKGGFIKLSSFMPGPIGGILGQMGMGQRGRGQAWQNYVNPIYSGLSPVIAKDLTDRIGFLNNPIVGSIARFADGHIRNGLTPR